MQETKKKPWSFHAPSFRLTWQLPAPLTVCCHLQSHCSAWVPPKLTRKVSDMNMQEVATDCGQKHRTRNDTGTFSSPSEAFSLQYCFIWASLVAQWLRICLPMQEKWVQSLGQEDLLEEGMTTHSRTLAWRIPWTEEPGGLQSMGSHKSQTHPLVTKQQ